jgi:hypothetical protein
MRVRAGLVNSRKLSESTARGRDDFVACGNVDLVFSVKIFLTGDEK